MRVSSIYIFLTPTVIEKLRYRYRFQVVDLNPELFAGSGILTSCLDPDY